MSQDNELRRLEQFVEKLLARFSELRAEKTRLLQELHEREIQIEELQDALSSSDMERGEISERVGKLVEQIEEWEVGLGETGADVSEPSTNEDTEVASEEEALLVTEAVTDVRGEEEGRVQQNLFSIGNTHR
jgi:predicted nuclease with TOPRIM domain